MIEIDVHENLAEQPPEIVQELLETPRLCMLLNPKMTLQQRRGIASEHYVVKVNNARDAVST